MNRLRSVSPSCCLLVAILAALTPKANGESTPENYVAGALIQLNDNGAWSWFMDERVIIDRGKLIVGSVRAIKNFNEGKADPNWGNVELAVYDLATGKVEGTVLQPHYEQDDHNGPALYVRPDGRRLAVYTKHGVNLTINYRISEPGDPLRWSEAKSFETPGHAVHFGGDSVTYSNLFRLPNGRTYNFHRGVDHDPNYLVSTDDGQTWRYGGRLLHGRDGYSPYLKYAQAADGTIHFVATEDHPRNFDNSLYHGQLRDGVIQGSDGAAIGPLSTSTDVEINAWDLTKVYQGDPDHVAWMTDIELDDEGRPVVAFSVQRDGRDLPPRQGGADHRYSYARWDGEAWQVHEIAFAGGARLYSYEDDYTGLASLVPRDPNTIVISTDADPETGEPLISAADGQRHHELFVGRTGDAGATWSWTSLTANSSMDNLRPLIPKWNDRRTAIDLMRGSYRHNHGEWTTAVAATILPPGFAEANP